VVATSVGAQPGQDPGEQPLPTLTPETERFFTSGLEGLLTITTCADCGHLSHPPLPVCARCCSRRVCPEPVSGRATVEAFTVNHYPWHPAFPPPYVVAVVSLEEQPDVHLTTNIVDCAAEDVRVGMPVEVAFRIRTDASGRKLALPVFRPRNAQGDAGV
jgi:uncharacterized protein